MSEFSEENNSVFQSTLLLDNFKHKLLALMDWYLDSMTSFLFLFRLTLVFFLYTTINKLENNPSIFGFVPHIQGYGFLFSAQQSGQLFICVLCIKEYFSFLTFFSN